MSSDQSNSEFGMNNALVALGPRQRSTLQNPDGTPMTTEDYKRMAY